jgi:nicotinamide mononucleotide transporter
MGFLEPIATVLGVAHLFLLIRQSLWAFPAGIAMVSLYGVIFLDARLYGQVGLQAVFCALLIYGWWYWLSHRSQAEADEKAPVRTLSARAFGLWLLAGTAGLAALGAVMARYTDGVLPFVDAGIACFSLVAQVLLARKYLQNWLVWIGVDVVAIGLYFSQGLYLTSGLYGLFLAMCVWGYVEWRRDISAAAPAAP